MDLLNERAKQFAAIYADRRIGSDGVVTIQPLSPDDAVGARADREFVIKKGEERVIEATFDGASGQAFTDTPSERSGSLRELVDLDLSAVRDRALFVAGVNAVMCFLEAAKGTIHCKDEDPARCDPDNVRAVDLNPDNIGATKSGVPIWDGEADLYRLMDWCEVGFSTGSIVVNGTIDDIIARFERTGKPLVLFGNTIPEVAALLSLDRLCPFAGDG